MRRYLRRRHVLLFLGVMALLASLPVLAHRWLVPVEFNQFLIERADRRYNVRPICSFAQRARSAYGSGVRALTGGGGTAPDLSDPDSVLTYVLGWAPPDAIVYPTEVFYYFRFNDREQREVWGNLRVAELSSGRLGLSYFRPGELEFTHKTYDASGGLSVEAAGEHAYHVQYSGTRVRFYVPPVVTEPPDALALDPDERYVARIVDESGIRLHLLFNESSNSFYMALDESNGTADRLEASPHGIVLGSRTGFAYFDEPETGRKLLVGVRLDNIAENNYFDGPGDQVPYAVPIRDLLHLAYPHTMLGSGIDRHGVLQGVPDWQRIAVTPFARYRTLDEVAARVDEALAHEQVYKRRTAMTQEWWNTPLWVASKVHELRAEGKALAGRPPGLLTLDELMTLFPEHPRRAYAGVPMTVPTENTQEAER